MSTGHGTSWGTLTREDLRDFDGYSTKAVLTAVERGAVGRRSSRGHIILRSPDGRTMSVSRSSNKSKHVVRQQLDRLFPEPPPPPKEEPVTIPANMRPANSATNPPRPGVWLACPVKGCGRTFPTEGGRYSHIDKEHERCKEEGCDAVSMNRIGAATHHRLAHEGWKPRKGTGKAAAQEAPAHQEGAVPDLPTEATGDAVTASAPDADPPTPPQEHKPQQGDAATLQSIRKLLGPDPRVANLETELAATRRQLAEARQRASDAEARLALMREALEA